MTKPFSFSIPNQLVGVLDALAYLEGVPPTTYLRELVIEHLESRSEDKSVEQAVKLRVEHQAKKSGVLHELPTDQPGETPGA